VAPGENELPGNTRTQSLPMNEKVAAGLALQGDATYNS